MVRRIPDRVHRGTWRPVLSLLVGLVLAGCTGGGSSTSATSLASRTPGEGYRLDILKTTWDDALPGVTDLDTSWKVIKQLSLQDPAMTIRVDDIQSYSWADQTIALTAAASHTFRNTFFVKGATPLELRCFVVSLDGERLYGGVFLPQLSAIGIGFPVLDADWDSNSVTLLLRPRHSGVPYSSLPESTKQVIEIPSLHAYLQAHGKLSD